MSIAKQHKMKEYGTDILSHDSNFQNGEQINVRFNNTFKSSIMDQEIPSNGSSTLKGAKSQERIFKNRPLTAQVQRASYQDSNIFGYKDSTDPTVQQANGREQSQNRTRYNPTFSSRVFSQQSGPDESERPPSRSRQDEKWMSTIFEGPVQEPCKRKKLGRGDTGTEGLFGKDRVDFDNKSNTMNIIGAKKVAKQWKPVRAQKTAEQRKHEELHGRSAAIYGTGKKKDGSLMANGADWRNLNQTHVNSPVKQRYEMGETTKDKKYQNLQSNILGSDSSSTPPYNPEADKAAFGCDANWTSQAGSAKVINKGYKQDPYRKKQQQLSSQVFDLTDYSEYQPMSKKKVDMNNLDETQRKNNHMYSDILGQPSAHSQSQRNVGLKSSDVSNWSQAQETRSQTGRECGGGYSTKTQKHAQLKSALDTHNFQPSPVRAEPIEADSGPVVTVPGKPARATKIRDLSSDVLGTGNTIQHYAKADNPTYVADLDIKGLTEATHPEDLKKISGAKHIISAVVDHDAITNTCTGTGRIKLRLGGEDELDNVKLQFLKAGLGVQEHADDTKMKTNFSKEQTLSVRSPVRQDIDYKQAKLSNLQTNNPEIFGNSNTHQQIHAINFDGAEIGKDKVASQVESQAIVNWTKVGGKR